jgi:hypothetical protein
MLGLPSTAKSLGEGPRSNSLDYSRMGKSPPVKTGSFRKAEDAEIVGLPSRFTTHLREDVGRMFDTSARRAVGLDLRYEIGNPRPQPRFMPSALNPGNIALLANDERGLGSSLTSKPLPTREDPARVQTANFHETYARLSHRPEEQRAWKLLLKNTL